MFNILQQHNRTPLAGIAGAIVLIGFTLLWGVSPTHAQTQAGALVDTAQSETLAESPLEGLEFRAGIVRSGDGIEIGNALEDRLIFRNGTFSSAVCERYNFAAAPYSVQRDGTRIHFQAELTSPTDGKMVWKGTIEDGKLEGTMHWTRPRWYWTVDAEHEIRGEIDAAAK